MHSCIPPIKHPAYRPRVPIPATPGTPGTHPHRYFAYGSNLCPQQMAERCPGAQAVGVGELVGHRLVFNRSGSYRPGGVGSVIAGGAHDIVYGVIWALTDEHVATLDRIEDPTAYERITSGVRTDGGVIACVTYVSIPQAEHIPPDAAYLEVIRRGAVAHGLPRAYIEALDVRAR